MNGYNIKYAYFNPSIAIIGLIGTGCVEPRAQSEDSRISRAFLAAVSVPFLAFVVEVLKNKLSQQRRSRSNVQCTLE